MTDTDAWPDTPTEPDDLDTVGDAVAAAAKEAAEAHEATVSVGGSQRGPITVTRSDDQAEAAEMLRAHIEANPVPLPAPVRTHLDRPVDTRMEVDDYIWFHVPLTRAEVVAICQQEAGSATAPSSTEEHIRRIVVSCLITGVPQSVSLDAWQSRIDQLNP